MTRPRWLTIALVAGLLTVNEATAQMTIPVPFSADLPGFCPQGGRATVSGNVTVTISNAPNGVDTFQGLATAQLSNPTNNRHDCTGLLGAGLILSGSVSVGIVNGVDLGFPRYTATCNLNSGSLGVFMRGAGGGLTLVQDLGFRFLGTVDCHYITLKANPPF